MPSDVINIESGALTLYLFLLFSLSHLSHSSTVHNIPLNLYPDSAVEYRNIIVTPGLIQFSRLQNPGSGYRLAVCMSAAASTGITQGAGLPVLVDAGFIPEQTLADITTVYIDRLTVRPTVGSKYFIETSWMDVPWLEWPASSG